MSLTPSSWREDLTADLRDAVKSFHINGIGPIELLLAAGADVHMDPRGMGVTALHLVAGGGADGTTWLAPLKGLEESDVAAVIKVMVGAGGNIHQRDRMYGAQPLAWAAWYGKTLMTLLIRTNSDDPVIPTNMLTLLMMVMMMMMMLMMMMMMMMVPY
jgi:ankyrin repeat protein